MPPFKIRYCPLSLIIFISIFFTPTSIAENVSELSLKTLYIYNFSRFVEWSELKNKTDQFIICTYPNNPFHETLYQLENQSIQKKRIKIKELVTLKGISSCHVLYVNRVSDAKLNEVIYFSQKYSILTISDKDNFAEKGGMIEMYFKKNKIRFNINYERSQQASLIIHSKLLHLASHIIRDEPLK